jgi:hypothetical protein
MKGEDPNSEHQSVASGAPLQEDVEGDAQASGNESGTEEGDPEDVPGNPVWYQRPDGHKTQKMVNAEHDAG